jgi:hypothetical protein
MVIVPAVAALPVLFGVNVKLALIPTVKLAPDATLLIVRFGACTTVITTLEVLFPAPIRDGSSGSAVPDGPIAVDAFANVPLCGAVPVMVNVTVPPAGRVVIVLETLFPATLTVPHTAPPVADPQDPPTPVMAAGTESVNTVRFAGSGPALLTVDV